MNYVLDTNVLLHDPQALFSFGENDVWLPIYIFDELDKFKKELSQRGKSARDVIRKIEAMRQKGSLADGIPMGENLGSIHVAYAKTEQLDVPFESNIRIMDNAILATVKSIIDVKGRDNTIFVTMDVNLRLRADALAMRVEDYEGEAPRNIEEHYTGFQTVVISSDQIDALYRDGSVPWSTNTMELYPNEFVLLKSSDESLSPSGTARYIEESGMLRLVTFSKKRAHSGIRARNPEQSFAFDILLDPEVKLVTLVGKAGTGKTLLAIAAGLEAMETDLYKTLVVSRPIFPMGKEMGFLPGDVDAKLTPWMQPIYDNLELISQNKNGLGSTYKEVIAKENIRIEPLTYIRGRSLPNQYIIVDEAQNLTPHEVKTIITRCGDGTKIVLTGDPYQIDNPYVDSTNNGLSYVVEKFKRERVAAHLTLQKGERSHLAELASNLL